MISNYFKKFFNVFTQKDQKKYFELLETTNWHRFKLISIFFIAIYLMFYAQLIKRTETEFIIAKNIYLIQLLFSIVFYTIFYFTKFKKYKIRTILCYCFIIGINLLQLMHIYNDIQYNKPFYSFTVMLYFTATIPNFSPCNTFLIIISFYMSFLGLLAYTQTFYYHYVLLTFLVVLSAIILHVIYYQKNKSTFEKNITLFELNQSLCALVCIDNLTNLDNRRSFDDNYQYIWDQCKHLEIPLSILMIDVDNFKRYNDARGHMEGDLALKSISDCMRKSLKRKYDFLARYGGEEFVILLPYTKQSNAVIVANNILKNVENLNIHYNYDNVETMLTISIGVCTTTPKENEKKEIYLALADKALYKAKKLGKNKVCENYYI